MHFDLIIFFHLLSFYYQSFQQTIDSSPRSHLFNQRCPPQLDRTVYKCIRRYLIDVPYDIHRETKLLDLSSNCITILHESNFVNLQHLKRLVLDDNKIWKITQNTFLPLIKLTDLSLRNNQLSIELTNSITAKILAPLQSLKSLDLSHNRLGTISEDLFVNSTKINCLILDSVGAPLKLPSTAFNYLPKLELLSLEGNQLVTLPENIFKNQNLLDINNIRLANNPWNCNCSLKWLRISLESEGNYNHLNYYSTLTTISHKKHNPSCFLPLQWKGFPLSQVPIDRFNCKTEIFVKEVNVSVSVGSQASLICEFYFANKLNSTITWYHNKQRVISSGRKYQRNDNSINITSILNISRVNYLDTGIYQCQIQTEREIVKRSIHLTVTKSSDEFMISGIRIVFTIGTILASVIIVVVAILAIVYLIKHRAVFCSDDSKFDSLFNPKRNERKLKNQENNPSSLSTIQTLNVTPNDSSFSLLPCSRNEYLSLHEAHKRHSTSPYLLLQKPAFHCTHNLPYIINRSSNLTKTFSFDNQTKKEHYDTYTLPETENDLDSYLKCPVHGHQSDPVNPDTLIDEPLHSQTTNGSVNINCPLHGYKTENLFYYELSNDYK